MFKKFTSVPRKTRRIALSVLAGSVGTLVLAAPASADYSGSLSSSPTWGATADYTVTRLSSNEAEISGRIKDIRADGMCAHVKAWVPIDYAVDPSDSAQACGSGTSASFRVYTRDLNGWGRIQGIKLRVCRRTSADGYLTDCAGITLTRETF